MSVGHSGPLACCCGPGSGEAEGGKEAGCGAWPCLCYFWCYFVLSLCYICLIFCVILGYDAIVSFSFGGELGLGVGSIVMTLNAIFLTAFTFGCNSLRHLVGGNLDCYSCSSFGHQRYHA